MADPIAAATCAVRQVVLLAVSPGGQPHDPSKLAGEIVAVRETAAEGDLGDAVAGGSELGGGVMNAELDQVSNRGQPHAVVEGAEETAFAHPGHGGERSEVERLVEVGLEMGDGLGGAQQVSRVVVS